MATPDRHPRSSAKSAPGTGLPAVLGPNAVTLLGEVIGGLLTGSLALLADAGHMLTDISGIALTTSSVGLPRGSIATCR